MKFRALEDLEEELLSKRLVLISGKGGTGKSLVSATLALKARARGKKVCVVESAAVEQVSPLLGFDKAVGHQLSFAQPGLATINLNPQDNFRDFVSIHLGHRTLFESIFTKSIVRSFIQMIPGIAELTLLGRLYYYAELFKDPSFDLIIYDGFASGHFLSLLKTPEAILGSGLTGPVVFETQRVLDYLQDQTKTHFVQITLARELVIGESLDFCHRFAAETPFHWQHLIVNRALEAFPQQLKTLNQQPLLAELWQAKRQEYDHCLARLDSGLKDLTLKPQVACLMECGAVPEPLELFWLNKWFSLAMDGVSTTPP